MGDQMKYRWKLGQQSEDVEGLHCISDGRKSET
jgi:hypothetical protein